MASIRKLPSGKFYCQIRRKGSPPQYQTFQTKTEAENWANEQDRKALLPNLEIATKGELNPNLTLRDVGNRYCNEVLGGKPSHYQTVMRLERIAKVINKPFVKVTQWDINEYKQLRLRSVSNTTCRDELLLIRRLYRWVQREYLVSISNPSENITLPIAAKPRDKVVSKDEITKLLSALSHEMAIIIELAYETAMRRSEITSLEVQSLHLEERYLEVINGKTGDRLVPLTSRAVELLQQALKTHKQHTSKVFTVTPHGVSQALRRARRKLGLSEDIRVHQLRHSRISIVARRGFNNSQIMAVSGHKDLRSVQRYTHLNALHVVDLLD